VVRRLCEWWIGKDGECSGRGLFEGIIPTFTYMQWGISQHRLSEGRYWNPGPPNLKRDVLQHLSRIKESIRLGGDYLTLGCNQNSGKRVNEFLHVSHRPLCLAQWDISGVVHFQLTPSRSSHQHTNYQHSKKRNRFLVKTEKLNASHTSYLLFPHPPPKKPVWEIRQ
jgi:hypothetical protein